MPELGTGLSQTVEVLRIKVYISINKAELRSLVAAEKDREMASTVDTSLVDDDKPLKTISYQSCRISAMSRETSHRYHLQKKKRYFALS